MAIGRNLGENPVISIDWTAFLGAGVFLLALAVVVAVLAGGWAVNTWIRQQRDHRLQKARILRTEMLIQLRLIENQLTTRHHPLDHFGKELFEPLQALWMQADLLDSQEMEAVHRVCRVLLSLRNKPSLNKKDVNLVMQLIQQTYQVFDKPVEKDSVLKGEPPNGRD